MAGDIFTVARDLPVGRLGDGNDAGTSLAALPDGGFIIGERGRVVVVGVDGISRTLAGTGWPGDEGDNGPATSARVDPSAVAVAPDGGVLIAQCDRVPGDTDVVPTTGRIRRIAADGTIATVAGGGRLIGDGGPATEAALVCPTGVAALPTGGFVVADKWDSRVRKVDPAGTISTLAGTGEVDRARLAGEHPATQVPMQPETIAVTTSGRVLVGDPFNRVVWQVRADGTASVAAGDGRDGPRRDDGHPAFAVPVSPAAIAATSDGGFLVADDPYVDFGERSRVRRVGPEGIISTIAGSARFVRGGLGRRGDGGAARRADLHTVLGVAQAADGGVLIGEDVAQPSRRGFPPLLGIVRYVAPPTPELFAVAVVRGSERYFTPGRPVAVGVTSTAPATIALRLSTVGLPPFTIRATVPAGTTRVDLPALTATPYRVDITATDAAGRAGRDSAELFPHGWLPDAAASYVAEGLAFAAGPWSSSSGGPVTNCRRFSAHRVDCSLNPRGGSSCRRVVTVHLAKDRRVLWTAYRCPIRRAPRLRRPLRPTREISCAFADTTCARLRHAQPLPEELLLPWG